MERQAQVRLTRGARVAIAVGVVAVLAMPTQLSASAAVSGKVGPYKFSTSAAKGAAGSCSYAGGRLAKITVKPAIAKMRPYWTKPHGGQVATGQYVDFGIRLMGEKGGKWTSLATRHKATLVGKSWKRMAALPAFTTKSGIGGSYSAYRVVESLQWLRPTDNAREGTASVTLAKYFDGARWASVCKRAPSPIAKLKAGVSSSAVKLTWADPPTATFKGIMIRYAKGTTSPTSIRKGSPVTLATAKATTVRVANLHPSTSYSFSIWVYDSSHHYSARRAITAKTHARSLPPIGTPTISPSASGTVVTWTASVDPNGRPATVRMTTDHGFDQTFTTGTTVWTSPTESQDVGYSATDNISVVVSDTGRPSRTATGAATTGSAPPPPPPPASVSVSRGGGCGSTCSGCSSCAYIHVTTANFGGNVTCSFNSQHGSDGFVSETYGANDSKDSWNYYGYPGSWVSATCGGVTGQTTW